MTRSRRKTTPCPVHVSWFLAGAWALMAAPACLLAQAVADRVTQPIDEARVVTLAGNVHPLAQPEFDQGLAEPETRLSRMVLLLAPSAAQQRALDALLTAQHDSHSALYQQWLTPADFGARFGVSAADRARIVRWLEAHGFTIDELPAGNQLILFSGTAAQVDDAFHASLHRYQVDGVAHLANAQDPQIPRALAGVVSGVVSLHDFRHVAAIGARRPLVAVSEAAKSQVHDLYPADYATIYGLKSLYGEGLSGTGVSIGIAGRSNIKQGDVTAFRKTAGLKARNPQVILDGANPGLVPGDQDEATLDVEWSGAVAPLATVKLVVAASTATTDGIDLASAYLVNHATAPVMSVSYGSCEQQMGTTELAFYNRLWQQAASQGISVFVAAGDSGAAGCTPATAQHSSQAGVNGMCSSPYATCVGGTEFNEGSKTSKYWSASGSPSQGSALGYIPEKVWNESAANGGTQLWATGGGLSAVYAQPTWQQGISGVSGMRAVPDVAMTAAAHDGSVIVEDGAAYVVAGTSAASPSFAAVMALLVEARKGKKLGNANPQLYKLARYAGESFHATPTGNNSVPGVAGFSAAGTVYNLATGLGSVDGALLVENWLKAASAK